MDDTGMFIIYIKHADGLVMHDEGASENLLAEFVWNILYPAWEELLYQWKKLGHHWLR